MIISELRRYQGVCYKSDITVISGQSGGAGDIDVRHHLFCKISVLLKDSQQMSPARGPAVLFNVIGILLLPAG